MSQSAFDVDSLRSVRDERPNSRFLRILLLGVLAASVRLAADVPASGESQHLEERGSMTDCLYCFHLPERRSSATALAPQVEGLALRSLSEYRTMGPFYEKGGHYSTPYIVAIAAGLTDKE